MHYPTRLQYEYPTSIILQYEVSLLTPFGARKDWTRGTAYYTAILNADTENTADMARTQERTLVKKSRNLF